MNSPVSDLVVDLVGAAEEIGLDEPVIRELSTPVVGCLSPFQCPEHIPPAVGTYAITSGDTGRLIDSGADVCIRAPR